MMAGVQSVEGWRRGEMWKSRQSGIKINFNWSKHIHDNTIRSRDLTDIKAREMRVGVVMLCWDTRQGIDHQNNP